MAARSIAGQGELYAQAARWLETVVVVAVTLILTALFGIGLGSIIWHPLSQAVSWVALSFVHPYAGLSFILYAEAAEAAFAAAGTGATASMAGLQTYAWAIATGLFVLMGVALWVRSIGLFRKRS